MNEETKILESAVSSLAEILQEEVTYTPTSSGVDAMVTIQTPHGRIELLADVKKTLTIASVHRIAGWYDEKHSCKTGECNRIIVTDRIGSKLSSHLRHEGIWYLDTGGNCWINSSKFYIYLNVGTKKGKPLPRSRPFNKAGLKIQFSLLTIPDAVNLTYRELAELADVSLGAVSYTIEGLRDLGYIAETRGGRRILLRRDRLIETWLAQFSKTLWADLLVGKFRFYDRKKFSSWRKLDLNKTSSVWGGEPAAAILSDYLLPEKLTIFTKSPQHELVEELRLVPDPDGNIEIREKFWDSEIQDYPNSNLVAPPLIIYFELLESGHSRNIEIAQRLFSDHISVER